LFATPVAGADGFAAAADACVETVALIPETASNVAKTIAACLERGCMIFLSVSEFDELLHIEYGPAGWEE
jgi:hypothetical protein